MPELTSLHISKALTLHLLSVLGFLQVPWKVACDTQIVKILLEIYDFY